MTQSNANNLTINSRVNSSALPDSIRTLLRDVVLEDGFSIEGSLYSHNLNASGSGTVQGSVLVRREVTLTPPEDLAEQTPMMFLSGIYAGVSLSVSVSDRLIDKSPVHDYEFTPLIIKGDIVAPRLRLENAVVAGNIHADSAVIRNSIILGTPVIDGRATFENVVMLSFLAEQVEFHGRNTILFPFGASKTSDMSFAPTTPKSELTWMQDPDAFPDWQELADQGIPKDAEDSWVRYLGLCYSERGCGGGGRSLQDTLKVRLDCVHHMEGGCPHADVRLNESDLVRSQDADPPGATSLTLANRFYDASRIEYFVDTITRLLNEVNMFDHYDDSTKDLFKANGANNQEHLGRVLYQILSPAFMEDDD